MTFTTGDFVVAATSVFLGWAEQNKHKKRLDLSFSPQRPIRGFKVCGCVCPCAHACISPLRATRGFKVCAHE